MPLTRRQIYRRRRIVVFGGLGLALALLGYLPMTLLAPLDPATATVATPVEESPEVPELDLPRYGAAAVGAVGFPGVLASSGSTSALPMASITKVVTALVALEAKPLAAGEDGPEIEMTAEDAGYYDRYLAQNGTVSPVRPGLRLTERDLLELTLVKSANNYAATLARWALGSESAYVAAATDWLAAHGLDGIRVTEPTGIDPANVGPADQIVELGRLALENPVVAEIVSLTSADIPELGAIPNTNKLLGRAGVDGIKTGTLDSFGANLLFSSDVAVGESSVTIVGVVLGGPDHDVLDRDILDLLDTVVGNFSEIEVAAAGESFGTYSTAWGSAADAIAGESARLLTWGGAEIVATVRLDDVRTGSAGDAVGIVTFAAGARSVQVPLVLGGDLPDPGPWWRLTHPGELL